MVGKATLTLHCRWRPPDRNAPERGPVHPSHPTQDMEPKRVQQANIAIIRSRPPFGALDI
ncbi:hypothetical protein RB213_012360 [Colletotrichum asianum]